MISPIASLKKIYWKRQARKGIKILEELDSIMVKAGYKRHERRRFWREFIKKQTNRFEIYKQLRKRWEK